MDRGKTGGAVYSAPSPHSVDAQAATNWQIAGCPTDGVNQFDSLVRAIHEGRHSIDIWDFERRLGLGVLWDWGDIQLRISEGLLTAARLDQVIHEGLADDSPRRGHSTIPGPG